MKKVRSSIYKVIFAIAPVLLTLAIFLGIRHYLGHLESDYTFLMDKVLKQKEYFQQVNFYGEAESEAPDLKINNQTILGLDSNDNGIRDDIDIWINRSALNKEEVLSMRVYAKELQVGLKNCFIEKGSLPEEKVRLINAENKLLEIGSVMRESKVFTTSRLKLLTFNTENRTKCFKSEKAFF